MAAAAAAAAAAAVVAASAAAARARARRSQTPARGAPRGSADTPPRNEPRGRDAVVGREARWAASGGPAPLPSLELLLPLLPFADSGPSGGECRRGRLGAVWTLDATTLVFGSCRMGGM
ncbi:hypothetical protein R5R35_004921 [Gryllus longicercus]|uniref:Uncharacterized protein n=1 Tax=Gryllus longicercus TaxID=2509291 RepID=A0AAN9VB90_9ORTH